MPRARCNWYGCAERPILAVPRRLIDDHVSYLERVTPGIWGGLCFPAGTSPVLDRDGEQRWYPRLCAKHAAGIGIEQLEQSRHYVQERIA